MSSKTIRIISFILMIIPSIMLVFSAIMKLSGAEEIVRGLTAAGLGEYISFLGVLELLAVLLFIYPKTTKVGFLLLCAYLGGALSIELAAGNPPMAAIFLTLIWISVFLRNRAMFLQHEAPAVRQVL